MVDTKTIDAGLEVIGAVFCGHSELYFSDPDHSNSGDNDNLGWANIQNARDLDTLSIAGRRRGSGVRHVRLADDVDVIGRLSVGGTLTLGGEVLASGRFTAGSLAVGAAGDPGAGNATVTGALAVGGKLNVGQLSVSHGMTIQGGPIRIAPDPGKAAEIVGDVAISGRLHGASLGPEPTANRIACGSTLPGFTPWVQYGGSEASHGLYVDVDTSAAGFGNVPQYFTSLGGETNHWTTQGATSIYTASATGFRVYLYDTGGPITPALANERRWHIKWLAVGA